MSHAPFILRALSLVRVTRPLLVVAATLALALTPRLGAAVYEVAINHPKATDDGPGSADRPWRTISRAARAVGPGDTVRIHGGIYRERIVVEASGTSDAPIRFDVAQGERVVVTGTDRLTDWRRIDDARPIFAVSWPHRFINWNPGMIHPDDAYHQVIGRCEQVIVYGYLLRQVLRQEQLAPGTFFADVTNRVLLVWDTANRDLTRAHVEGSVREEVFRVEGDHVHLRGLRFQHAANRAQRGAVILAGDHAVMEDCVIEGMNACGATFQGEDVVVRRCVFRDNGQLGFSAVRAHRLNLIDCVVENNNVKGFDRGWEAGGNKLVLCRDVVLERSRFVRNRGNGIWFDIGNTNCTVRHCLIADNEDAGIFYEISFGLQAHDNVIVGNGFASTAGAWGAQAGISISSSPYCAIERNLIVGNREGFNFREQRRTTPTIENRRERPVWNHDELIRHNLIAFNRDAQVWGWFDVRDNRHWPAPPGGSSPPGDTEESQEAGEDDAPESDMPSETQPRNLTLAELRLSFVGNIYYAASGQGRFSWGTTWARHKRDMDLAEFQSALGIDVEGQFMEPKFADTHQFDFRLPASEMPAFEECYPRGPVPGVRLGVTDAAR